MGTIVLTVKKNNYTAPLLGAAKTFILRKNLFIKSNYKSIGETANKKHLLQSNLLSNHTEVRLIIVCSSTELKDTRNNFPRKNKN